MRWIPEGGITFGLIGGVGFLVDGGMLTMLNSLFGMNVYVARAVSFLMATAATWYLNRTFSFRQRNKVHKAAKDEYLRYLLVQVGGGLLNLSVFVVLIYLADWMKDLPILPLAIGAIFGMVFNYALSRFWVFRLGANE